MIDARRMVLLVLLMALLPGLSLAAQGSFWSSDTPILRAAPDPFPTTCPAGVGQIGWNPGTGTIQKCEDGGAFEDIGTGTGAGSAPAVAAVQAVAPAEVTISNPETAVFDGVTLSNGHSVLLPFQADISENGVYVFNGSESALTRRPDLDEASAFVARFTIPVLAGGSQFGATLWEFVFVEPVTLGTSELLFLQVGVPPTVELTTRKGAVSGYAPLNTQAKIPGTHLGSYAQHDAVSAGSQIMPSGATTLGLVGSGGPVTLDSGDPRITGCTAMNDGRLLLLHGIGDAVTIPNGQGVRLCGNAGAVTVGLDLDDVLLVCREEVWREVGCRELQRSTGRTIAADALNPVQITDPLDATTSLQLMVREGIPSIEGQCGGSPCANVPFIIRGGGAFSILDAVGAPLVTVDHDTGDGRAYNDWQVDGRLTGPSASVQSACQVIPQVSGADTNMLFASFGRAVTITAVWCHYQGSAPTTGAQFRLEDGAGNIMTHTAPTCAAPSTVATTQAITAGGALTAREVLRFDVTNIPNPTTETYMLCVAYDTTD